MTLRAAMSLGAKADMLVAPRVCDCCPTAAADTADGPIVAFRGRTADEIRDIYVTRLDGSSLVGAGPGQPATAGRSTAAR